MVLVLGGLLAALPASAKGLADEIARQMAQQGFQNIGIEETWLGRTRITGIRNGGSREIIVNPNTGEILRDLWLNAQGQVRAADIDLDLVDDAADDAADAIGDRLDDRKDAQDDADDSSGSGSGDSGSNSGSDDSGGGDSGRAGDRRDG